jgi:tripartite-type tricarboxylate transporter receptor subunit TctC
MALARMTTSRFARAALAAALALASFGAAAQWKPSKPITIIVPWSAGGSTDQVTRITAGELEKVLGQKVVIVNQPGAAGSIGTKNALEAAKDGYTWTAGAAQDLGAYRTLGMLDTNIGDWNLYLHVANVPVVAVNPNSPYKTLPELLDAMKAKPGQITVATAGVTSGGHNAMEAISRATGAKYRHVTYDGGNPAVVATVAGETEVTTQLAVEQAEMIRAKRLRPLASVSDKPVVIEGYGTIEPITKWVPGFKAATNYFGIFVPKGVPPEVVATLDKAWAETIANNAALRKYATERGAVFAPVAGAAAQQAALPAVQANAWLMFDSGKAKVFAGHGRHPAALDRRRVDER